MGDRTQINLVVDTDRKQEWEQAAEDDPEYESLSHLIRLSVLRELDRDHSGGGGVDVDFTQIESRFDNVEARLDEVSSNIQTLLADREQEDLTELTNEVYKIIPRIPDEELWQTRLHDGNTDIVEHEAGEGPEDAEAAYTVSEDPDGGWDAEESDKEYEIVTDQYQTIEDIATELEVSEYRARLAVQRVEDSFARVNTYTYDGETFVYEVA